MGENDTEMTTKQKKEMGLPESALVPAKKTSETAERSEWTGQFDFLMSMIAYAVGLGRKII